MTETLAVALRVPEPSLYDSEALLMIWVFAARLARALPLEKASAKVRQTMNKIVFFIAILSSEIL